MHVTTRVLAAAAAAAAMTFSVAGPASAGVDPRQNHASSWESEGVTCTKVELSDGVKSWTIEQGSGFYVFKAGTANTVVDMDPFGSSTYMSTKDISHVITCNGSYGS